jgi:type I restriction enzyme, S subunit
LSEEWNTIRLGELITLQRGFDLPKRNRKPGNVPIITSSGFAGTHNQAPVTGPGVVTGRYGTIGQVFFIAEDFWPHNTALFVSDFKGNDPLFVSFLLRTIDFHTHSGKSGVPGINRNDLHEVEVKRPPIKEQKAIAKVLRDVDDLLASLDRLIAKKRAVKLATMQQLLTGEKRLAGWNGRWETVQLGDTCIFYSGGTPLTSNKEYYDGNIPWITSSDLNKKQVVSVKGRISKNGFDNSSANR